MFKKIAVLSLALAANSAFAFNWGSWRCTWGCEDLPLSPVDVSIFVSVYVNQVVPVWRNGDTFKICNIDECQQFVAQGFGTVFINTGISDNNVTLHMGEGDIFW